MVFPNSNGIHNIYILSIFIFIWAPESFTTNRRQCMRFICVHKHARSSTNPNEISLIAKKQKPKAKTKFTVCTLITSQFASIKLLIDSIMKMCVAYRKIAKWANEKFPWPFDTRTLNPIEAYIYLLMITSPKWIPKSDPNCIAMKWKWFHMERLK